MMIVLTLGKSSPASMIIVQRSRSNRLSRKSIIFLLQVALVHLPVRVRDPHPGRQEPVQVPLHHLDRLDPVVHEKDLPSPVDLAHDRVPYRPVVEGEYLRMYWKPVARSRVDDRYVAYPGDRHREGPRYRGRRHAEHVDALLHHLEDFLVPDAEPVLLVDDHEAEILEGYVLRQQPVRADDDVDLPLDDIGDGLLLPGGGNEPAEHLRPHREPGEPVGQGGEMLHREHRRRDEDRHLFPFEHHLERGPERHLGLPEPHVAA